MLGIVRPRTPSVGLRTGSDVAETTASATLSSASSSSIDSIADAGCSAQPAALYVSAAKDAPGAAASGGRQ